VWYLNVLIELFHFEIWATWKIHIFLWRTQNCRTTSLEFLLPHKGCNLPINVLPLSGLLVLGFFFRPPPSWPGGSSCRGGVTRKDAWWLNYFAFVQPLFQLYKFVSDYKEKFQIEHFSKIYKYFQKSIFQQICSVPNRKTLQMALQIFNKLPVSLYII